MPLVPLAPIARAPAFRNVAPVQLTSNANRTAQIGRAIGQAGETLVNLKTKYDDLVDARSMIAAENVMRQTTNDFDAWRRNPENADESAWLPKWQEMQSTAQKQIDGLKMTEKARLITTRSWGRWSDAQTVNVQGNVFKQGVQRTKDALDLRMKQAIDLGDDSTIRSTVENGVSLGVYTPEEGALVEYDASKAAKGTRRERFNLELKTILDAPTAKADEVKATIQSNADLTDSEKSNLIMQVENRFKDAELEHLIDTNPVHGFEAAQNDFARGKITANKLDELTRRAETVKTRERGKQYEGIVDAMKARTPKDGIAKMLDEGNFLTPGDKAELMLALDKRDNDPMMLSTLAKEAANFQHAPDSPEYFLFTKRVDALTTGNNRSHILGLRDKALAGEKEGGSFSRSFGKVFSFADDDLKNGVFGPTTGKLSDIKTVLPPKIRAEVDTLKTKFLNENAERIKKEPQFADYAEAKAREAWWNTQNEDTRGESFRAFEVEDAAASRSAAALQVQTIQELEAFRKANPNKTASELVSEYGRIVARMRSARGMVPTATGSDVNPADTLLPNLDDRLKSILSK